MPTEKIEFYIREVYGVQNMYIANEEEAQTIRALTGTKTLLKSHKSALEKMGFEFVQVLAPIKN